MSSTRSPSSADAPAAFHEEARLVELKDVSRIVGWLAQRSFYLLLPIPVLLELATAAGHARFLVSREKPEALARLRRSLGAATGQRELQTILRRHFEFRARTAALQKAWPRVNELADSQSFDAIGLNHLDASLADGKGAILVSAHFGYARLIKPVLRARGYDILLVGMVSKEQANSTSTRLGSFVYSMLRLPRVSRGAVGGSDVPSGINLRPHLAALKRNQALVLLVDGKQAATNAARPPIEVLGRRVALTPGAIAIARATGAPVLPVFVVDEATSGRGCRIRLEILPPLELRWSGETATDLQTNLERFAAVLEDRIRAHPHLWRYWTRSLRSKSRRRRATRRSVPTQVGFERS